MRPVRAKFSRWLKVAVGVALLAFIVSRVDPRELALLAHKGDGRKLALGLLLLYLANPILQALRLHVLVARYTQSVWLTFKIFFVSAFFNTMLPSNVGGDAVRLLYLRRLQAQSWGGPFVLLMLHRFTGMLVLLVAAGAYALASWERIARVLRAAQVEAFLPLGSLAWGAVLLCAAAGAWLALSTRHRARLAALLRRFGAECTDGLRRVGLRATIELLVLTTSFHVVRMLAFYVLVQYAGQSIRMFDVLIVLAATAIAGVIPISVGGLGLMEGAISVTLGLFGVSQGAAFAAAAANRLVMWLGAAIGGLVYLGSRDGVSVSAAVAPASAERQG
jgi:uncharacterized membrane protein YbhN (UPF0104 family)